LTSLIWSETSFNTRLDKLQFSAHRFLQMRDEITAVLLLLQTRERHLRPRNVLGPDISVGGAAWVSHAPFWGSPGTRRGFLRSTPPLCSHWLWCTRTPRPGPSFDRRAWVTRQRRASVGSGCSPMEVGSNFVALAGAQLIQDLLASKRKF
jgi:hypothetical protein